MFIRTRVYYYDTYFKETNAKAIKYFLEKQNPIAKMILVSCEDGISRPSGILAALNEYFNKEESELFYSNSKFPNMLVYKILSRIILS